MPNFHTPKIVDRATPVYRALLLECERRRQQLGWSMWQVDDASGLNDGHYAHCLHVDRVSGRQARWETLSLIVTALWPLGFDLQMTHKPGGILTAEDHRLKVMFAAADNNRLSRRELMRELGRRGGIARREKLAAMPLADRLKIARKRRKQKRALRKQSCGLPATAEARL
jgi:hypothetical protein